MGRGTTVIESALLGRKTVGNDVNPLCRILTWPRLNIPSFEDVDQRINQLRFSGRNRSDIVLSMFYHGKTLAEIVSLRRYLEERDSTGREDRVDKWIRMVATNRLTGHSGGFFSVYTLPPNQATTRERQRKINLTRRQEPEYRDICR